MSTDRVHLESLQNIVIIGRQTLEAMKMSLAFKRHALEATVVSDNDRAKLTNDIIVAEKQLNEFRRALNRHEFALASFAEKLGVER